MLLLKNYIFLLFTVNFFQTVCAQPGAAITGTPDTSFSNYSEYIKLKQKHPGIKLVIELKSKDVYEKRSITYCSLDKRKLLLDAFCPVKKSTQGRAAILIIHGGGWRSGNRAQHYPLAQKLAELGYVCFTPEYRLSTEALYPAAVHDLKAAIRWIYANAKKYNVDTAKITVLGFSAGGELAAFLGTTLGLQQFEGNACNLKYKANIHAVVDIDGTLSFVHAESGEGDDTKKVSAATQWFGVAKKDNPELWQQASPLNYVSKNTPPTLFINSSVQRMHAGRNDYIKVLSENNIYSEVHEFEETPHSFCLFEPWFEPTIKYIDDFLKKIFVNK